MIRSMKRTSWDDGETYLCFEETRLLSIGSVERTLTIKQKDNTVFIKITPELRGFIEDGVF